MEDSICQKFHHHNIYYWSSLADLLNHVGQTWPDPSCSLHYFVLSRFFCMYFDFWFSLFCFVLLCCISCAKCWMFWSYLHAMQKFVKEITLRLEFYRIVASVKFSSVQFSSIFAFFLFGRSTFGFYIWVLVPASDTPNTYTHSHIINIADLIQETIRVDIEIEIEIVI